MTQTPAKAAAPKLVTSEFPAKLKLNPSTLHPTGHSRRFFGPVRAPAGATQDDCRSPYFLARCAQRLVRHDIIFVLADDESWELELCVEKALPTEVHVSARKAYSRQSIAGASLAVDDAGEYRAEFRAGQAWCIVRTSDGHAIIEGRANAGSAIAEFRSREPRKAA